MRAYSAMSPVQPAFSRWGQSVGMDSVLPRWLQRVFSYRRLSRASEQAKVPASALSLVSTTAVNWAGLGSSSPVTRT